MRFTRRRPDRPDPTGGWRDSRLELLERRDLLSHVSPSAANYYAPWVGTDLAVSNQGGASVTVMLTACLP